MAVVQVLQCEKCGSVYNTQYDGLYCPNPYCRGLLKEVWITIESISFKERRRNERKKSL